MRTTRVKAAVLGVGPLVVLMGALSQGSGDCGEGSATGVVPSCTPTPGPTTTTRTATPSSTGTPSTSATPTATATTTSTVAVMGQDSVALADGLTVSTSAPTVFTPSDTAAGVVAGGRNLAFDVVVVNNSSTAKTLSSMTITADSANGPGEQVFDSAQNIGGTSNLGQLAAGQTATVRVGFSLPASTSTIDVEVQPLLDGESALFTGTG
jgi:hypothetical protein